MSVSFKQGHGGVSNRSAHIIGGNDLILVTGAGGFIGSRVIERLIALGFRNLRCMVRPSGKISHLESLREKFSPEVRIEILKGNLLSRPDCISASKDAAVVYHLAAGRGEKMFADAFMNSVVTTRNLLDAISKQQCIKRVVSISSFSVYSNIGTKGGVLDESSAVESKPALRGDAYSFAKLKQDALVAEYGGKFGIPYVIVRPGFVYGPGNEGITGRVGISTFGIFLHLGGSNAIPFTYVDNCAEAIVLAGINDGIDGEVFNVVDDNLPSSRKFLAMYKKQVRHFKSIYVPHAISYLLCYLWEKYSAWSEGQLPPAFNRRIWHSYWKKTRYSNEKLKQRLGWKQIVPTHEAFACYFESCRAKAKVD
jgi:nucleoside-diphosphate-sugar epimerase